MAKAPANKKINHPQLIVKEDDSAAPKWKVFDTNQRGEKARIHEAGGRKYALYSDPDKPCLMPEHHARVFLKDEAFVVYNAQDEFQPPLGTNSELRAGDKIPELAVGQVIADIAELNDDALKNRIAQRAAHLSLPSTMSREKMIDVLAGLDQREIDRRNAKPKARSDGDTEDASPEEIDALFEAAA